MTEARPPLSSSLSIRPPPSHAHSHSPRLPVRVTDSGHSLFSTILCVDSSETPLLQYQCHLTHKHHTYGPGSLFLTLDKLYYYTSVPYHHTFICSVSDIFRKVEVKENWRPGWRRKKVGCVVVRCRGESKSVLRFWAFEELSDGGGSMDVTTESPHTGEDMELELEGLGNEERDVAGLFRDGHAGNLMMRERLAGAGGAGAEVRSGLGDDDGTDSAVVDIGFVGEREGRGEEEKEEVLGESEGAATATGSASASASSSASSSPAKGPKDTERSLEKVLMYHFMTSLEKIRLGMFHVDEEGESEGEGETEDEDDRLGVDVDDVAIGDSPPEERKMIAATGRLNENSHSSDEPTAAPQASRNPEGGGESDPVSLSQAAEIERRMLEQVRTEMGLAGISAGPGPGGLGGPGGAGERALARGGAAPPVVLAPSIRDEELDEDGVLMPVVPPPFALPPTDPSPGASSAVPSTPAAPATASDPPESEPEPAVAPVELGKSFHQSRFRTHETIPETPVIFSEANAKFTPREVSSFYLRLSMQDMIDNVIGSMDFVRRFHTSRKDKDVTMTDWKYVRRLGLYHRTSEFQMHINFPFTSRNYVTVTSMEQLTVLKGGKRILWQMSYSPKGFFGSDTLILQGNVHFVEAGRRKVRLIMRVGPVYVKNLTFLLKWKFTQVGYNILDDVFTAISKSLKMTERDLRKRQRSGGQRKRRAIAFSTRRGKKSSRSGSKPDSSSSASLPDPPPSSSTPSQGSGNVSASTSALARAADEIGDDEDDRDPPEPEEEGEVPGEEDSTESSELDESSEFPPPSSLPHPPGPSLVESRLGGITKIVIGVLCLLLVLLLLFFWRRSSSSGDEAVSVDFAELADRLENDMFLLMDEVRGYRDETNQFRNELKTALALNEEKWVHTVKRAVELELNWVKFEERYLDFSRRQLEQKDLLFRTEQMSCLSEKERE